MTDIDGENLFCYQDIGCTDKAFECVYTGSPNYGLTSFDNIFNAVMTSFEIISLEGWTDVMYQVRRVNGNYYYDAFFILTVELGAYLVLNLMIAVQFEYLDKAFTEINEKKMKDVAADKAELLENIGGE